MNLQVHRWSKVETDGTSASSSKPPEAEIHFKFIMLQWEAGIARRIGTCILTAKDMAFLNPNTARVQRFAFL